MAVRARGSVNLNGLSTRGQVIADMIATSIEVSIDVPENGFLSTLGTERMRQVDVPEPVTVEVLELETWGGSERHYTQQLSGRTHPRVDLITVPVNEPGRALDR
jgi:hypothetical protein